MSDRPKIGFAGVGLLLLAVGALVIIGLPLGLAVMTRTSPKRQPEQPDP